MPIVSGGGGACDAPDHCDGSSPLCADARAANGTPCDDFNPCTVNEACMGGVCTGGTLLPAGTNCFPGNDDPCNDFQCDSTGICQILFTTNPCDDGDACTQNDTCADGFCNGTPVTCALLAVVIVLRINHWDSGFDGFHALALLSAAGQVIARYAGIIPNGSAAGVAGVCNESGSVVGLMPHPEHAVDELTGPSRDGLGFFESVLSVLVGA